MRRQKEWTLTGCSLWIIGLILFIVGLNLEGDVKAWMNVAGSIVFLIGLRISSLSFRGLRSRTL